MKRLIAGFMAILTLACCLTGCSRKLSDQVAPPEMTVVLGDERVKALRGTTEWAHLVTKKEWYEVREEADLPMMRKGEVPCLEFTVSEEKNVVTLEFDIPPIDFYVNQYAIDAWGDIMAEYYEPEVDRTNFSFEISDEEAIYEVWARWYTNEGTKQQGHAYYSFYTKKVSE